MALDRYIYCYLLLALSLTVCPGCVAPWRVDSRRTENIKPEELHSMIFSKTGLHPESTSGSKVPCILEKDYPS